MNQDMPCPADLVSIASYLESCTSVQRFAIIAELNQAMLRVAVLRGDMVSPSPEAATHPDYTPHALDVLIISALELDGAQTAVQLGAAIEGNSYRSRGRSIPATASNVEKRVKTLARAGIIRSTGSGYIIADTDRASEITEFEFGE